MLLEFSNGLLSAHGKVEKFATISCEELFAMKKNILDGTTQQLSFQRNIFAALALLLAVSLILTSSLLFMKRERVVIVPPFVEKEFWVEASHISPTYLEQFGYFLGQLLLGKSAYSSPSQRAILLRHTDPAFVGALKQKLVAEEELLHKQNASYVFYPVVINAVLQKKEVIIEGDRIFYVSGKQVSLERETYVLSFKYTGSRLLLTGIRAVEQGSVA